MTSGTEALGEVTVHVQDGNRKAMGRGASTDVIEASAKAFIDGLNKLAVSGPGPACSRPPWGRPFGLPRPGAAAFKLAAAGSRPPAACVPRGAGAPRGGIRLECGDKKRGRGISPPPSRLDYLN